MIVKNTSTMPISFPYNNVRYNIVPNGSISFPDSEWGEVSKAIAFNSALVPQMEDDSTVDTMLKSNPITSSDQFIDHSINDAEFSIDTDGVLNFFNHVRTNQAGNFNGGGTGNKMLMGIKGFNNLPFNQAPSIEFVADIKQGSLNPYVQFLVQLGVGEPRIISLDSFLGSPVYNNVLKRTSLGGTRYKYEWDFANQEVYIVSGIVGALAGLDYYNTGGVGWTFQAYYTARIMAMYPSAVIKEMIITDGGAPKSKKLCGVYFGVGDSSTAAYQHKVIEYIKLNGTKII